MEYRPLDITVISAQNLKDVNTFSKMDVYALVSISGDPRTTQKTPVDKDSGTSPRWNAHMRFSVDEGSFSNPNSFVFFQIKSHRVLGDKDVGQVSVPMRELFTATDSGDGKERVVEYQVRTPSGKPKGTLKFSYRFGDKIAAPIQASKRAHEPVTAYPAPPHVGASTAYPPPPGVGYAAPYQHPGGHPHPPPAGYGAYPPPPQYGGGYPPAGGGYGYPPQGYGYPSVQQPQKKKNNKFGLGLGAGLLGGLLVGDMISDVGEMSAYDAGYDGGFGDTGDFDF